MEIPIKSTADEGLGLAGAGLETLRRNWKWIVLRGVLALALGIVALLFPITALFAFAMVFAAYAAADGIFSLVVAVRGARRKEDRWWVYVLRGIIGIATGALFVVMPAEMTIGYAAMTLILLAVWAIVSGTLEMYAAVRLRQAIEGEWLMGVSGALSVILGLAIVALMILDPLATLPSAAWVIGTYAVIAGVVLLVLGLRLRKA